ncbi:MAG: LCCL domain-containing protein [Gemmataceae bacterium]
MRIHTSLALIALVVTTSFSGAQTPGKKYALLVGVQDYQNELTALKFAEADMTALARVLIANGYLERDVILMTQARGVQQLDFLPTAANIRKQLDLLLRDYLRESDTVLVAFAGHGVQFKDEKVAYFCPTGCKLGDHSTLISLAEVYKKLEDCKAGLRVLLSDACRNDPLPALTRSPVVANLASASRPVLPAPQKAVAALFSCSAGELAHEHPDLGHGVFFHHVIAGLKGAADANNDGKVTLNELDDYVKVEVSRYVHNKLNAAQSPQRLGESNLLLPLATLSGDAIVRRLPNDGNLLAFASDIGETLSFQVTGSLTGAVWGTGVYTADSSLATAAVHAGVLTPGQTGVVRVVFVPPPPSIQGWARNGVRSLPYRAYGSTFRFVKPPVAAPRNLENFNEQVGQKFAFQTTGSLTGDIWGTGVYSTDSALATAAVHAGVLAPHQQGIVRVRIVSPPATFQPTVRNGVTSRTFESWPVGFEFLPSVVAAPPSGNLEAFRDRIGTTLALRVTGALEGPVWGTDVYTTDSALAAAAVHAGVLDPGQTGVVRLEVVVSPAEFQGSSRRGVTSNGFGIYPAAYRFVSPLPVPESGNLIPFGEQTGRRLAIRVTGSNSGHVWGTGLYTADSSLAAAAVHAGVLLPGQPGVVRVEIVPPPASFVGSMRFQVKSEPFGTYPVAFRFTEPDDDD